MSANQDSVPADPRLDPNIRRCKHQLEFDACIRCVREERDLYRFQAETNAQTVIGQANEIRRLGRLLDVEQRAVAAAHDVEERF
jgi:hypothetical protein